MDQEQKNIPSNGPAGDMQESANPFKPVFAAVVILLIAGVIFYIAGSGKSETDTPETDPIDVPELGESGTLPDIAVPDLDEPDNETETVSEKPDPEPAEDPEIIPDTIVEKAQPSVIWIEGEDSVQSSVSPHPWWYDKMVKTKFSGGGWISNWSDKPGTAKYSLDIPEDGDYRLWVRINPKDSIFSYKTEGGLWRSVNMKNVSGETVNTAVAEKKDMRYIAWVDGGKISLKKGKQSLEIKFHSKNSNHGVLDCFALSSGDFKPEGLKKPSE